MDYFCGADKNMKQKKNLRKICGKKKVIVAVLILIGVLTAAYLGTALFFQFHFLPGTKINGRDFSMKTAEDLERDMDKTVKDYVLNITAGNEGPQDGVYGREIRLKFSADDWPEKILKKQNGLLWIAGLFRENTKDTPFHVTYDETLLDERIEDLHIMSEAAETAVSAHPVFSGENFIVESEVYGVSKDMVRQKIGEYIGKLKPELNLLEEGCLEAPPFLSDSPEVQEACEIMNQYCRAKITYFMEQNVVVDAQVISGWLSCDENMNVTLDEAAVGQWTADLAEKYSTVGSTRSVTTPSGKTAEVSGGTYGWVIDAAAERTALLDHIKKGDILSKEPAYTQRAASRSTQDWGSTYLEVDLTTQHMWYIENGEVRLETDVVTGEPDPHMETPQGVYSILYTERDAVLVGEINPATGQPLYKTGVRYWMPFTQQGHGFHDADWKSAFGGSVYTYSGSHGCVNMPVDKAGELYAMLQTGTPVVIHY